jgi:hypothetical protein
MNHGFKERPMTNSEPVLRKKSDEKKGGKSGEKIERAVTLVMP